MGNKFVKGVEFSRLDGLVHPVQVVLCEDEPPLVGSRTGVAEGRGPCGGGSFGAHRLWSRLGIATHDVVAVECERTSSFAQCHVDKGELKAEVNLAGGIGPEAVDCVAQVVLDISPAVLVLEAVELLDRVEGDGPLGIVGCHPRLFARELFQLQRTSVIHEVG